MKNKILMSVCWKKPETGNKNTVAIPVSTFEFPVWETS